MKRKEAVGILSRTGSAFGFGFAHALLGIAVVVRRVAVVGVGDVTGGNITIDVGLRFAGAVIRSRGSDLLGWAVATHVCMYVLYVTAPPAAAAGHVNESTSTSKRIHRGHETLVTGSGGSTGGLAGASDGGRLAEFHQIGPGDGTLQQQKIWNARR
jgi:hypothetical protein